MWNDVARFALIVVLGHRNRRERASFVIGRSCLRRTVWALILLFVVDPGVLPGALALSVYIVGVLGRLDAEVIENLDPRPLVALRSCGAGPSAVFWYGVMPALAPQFVALSLYRWEVAIRETTVVGVVGAVGSDCYWTVNWRHSTTPVSRRPCWH